MRSFIAFFILGCSSVTRGQDFPVEPTLWLDFFDNELLDNSQYLHDEGFEISNFDAVPTSDRNGVEGQAVHFEGESWIQITDDSAFDFDENDSYSVSCWIRPGESLGEPQGDLITKWVNSFNPYPFAIRYSYAENLLWVGRYSGGVPQDASTVHSLEVGMYTETDCNGYIHTVIVFDGLTMLRIYLNGQLAGEQESTVTQSLYGNDSDLFVGRRGGSTNRFYQGDIDELRIFNQALTEEEVGLLYEFDGCGTQSSVSQIDIQPGMVIFPNPARENFNVGFEVPSRFQIIRSDGVIIWSSPDRKTSFTISTESFAPGLYFICTDSGFSDRIIISE